MDLFTIYPYGWQFMSPPDRYEQGLSSRSASECRPPEPGRAQCCPVWAGTASSQARDNNGRKGLLLGDTRWELWAGDWEGVREKLGIVEWRGRGQGVAWRGDPDRVCQYLLGGTL